MSFARSRGKLFCIHAVTLLYRRFLLCFAFCNVLFTCKSELMTDTLILGLAAGYHYGDVRPFLLSLQQSGCQAQLVLFTSPTTRDSDRMATRGATIIPCQRPPELAHIPANAWRFFLYRDYLQKRSAAFRRILLTDVRDVIFQADPFSLLWPEGYSLFQEDSAICLGRCEHTAHWIKGHLGSDTLQELAPFPLLCSGTTIADSASMLRYLDLMTARLLPFTPAPRMAGYDQGVHNLLARRGLLAPLHVFDNHGPVLTLGHKREPPALDAAGLVLNESGEPAVLVHQYDRHPELFAHIRRLYA